MWFVVFPAGGPTVSSSRRKGAKTHPCVVPLENPVLLFIELSQHSSAFSGSRAEV